MADTAVVNSTSGSIVVDNVDNPFQTNGALSKKADYIISHSTITRTELCIADPDNVHQTEEVLQQSVAKESHAAVPSKSPGSPTKQNGKAADNGAVTTASVEVEVSKATAVSAQPQHAEEVKLKQKKKCCTVQ